MSDILAGSPLIQAAGFALVAFLWQGAAIGLVALLLSVSFRRASAATRYLLGCVALATLTVAPVVTMASRLEESSAPARPGDSALSRSVATNVLVAKTETSGELAQGAHQVVDSRWSIVVIVWSVGVTVLGLHLLRGGLLVARLRRAGSPLVAADQLEALARLARRLRLTRPIRLVQSWAIDVPAVVGWVRPVVIVPMSALTGLSASHFEAILAHELGHVRRHDYLVNLIQRAVETLLFYHPAVWWVSSWIRREREHCCDDLAVSVCGDRVRYAHALRALEELRINAPALAMGARGGELVGRIRRLVNRTPDPLPGWPGGLAMIVPLIAFLTMANPEMSASAVSLPLPIVESKVTAFLPAGPPPAMPVDLFATAPTAVVSSTTPAAGRTTVQASGSISVTLTDPAGGVLPGATIVLRSRATTVVRTTVTMSSGSFTFSDLAAGVYDLNVSLSGFKQNQSVVNLAAGHQVTMTIPLELGTIAEEVNVIGRSGQPAPAAAQLPSTLQTATDYRAAALYYYDREDYAQADLMMTRAIELMQASQPARPDTTASHGPLWIGGDVRAPIKTHDVRPVYPSAALAAGSEGTVLISAIVSRDGSVAGANVTSTPSVFDDAALGAVRQWVFQPTLLNGVPVEVLMNVTVHFKTQ